jgi:hypothetical protein
VAWPILNPLLVFWKTQAVSNNSAEPIIFPYRGDDIPEKVNYYDLPENVRNSIRVHAESDSNDCDVYRFAPGKPRYVHLSPVTMKFNKENFGENPHKNLPINVVYDEKGQQVGFYHGVVIDGPMILKQAGGGWSKAPKTVKGLSYIAVRAEATMYAILRRGDYGRRRLIAELTTEWKDHGCSNVEVTKEVAKKEPVQFVPVFKEPMKPLPPVEPMASAAEVLEEVVESMIKTDVPTSYTFPNDLGLNVNLHENTPRSIDVSMSLDINDDERDVTVSFRRQRTIDDNGDAKWGDYRVDANLFAVDTIDELYRAKTLVNAAVDFASFLEGVSQVRGPLNLVLPAKAEEEEEEEDDEEED